MKPLFLILSLFIFQTFVFSQDEFYSYTPEGKVTYELSTKKILVKFDARLTFEQKRKLLLPNKSLKKLEKKMLLPAPKVAVIPLQPGTTKAQVLELLEILHKKEGILMANPFLVYKDGVLQSFESQFIVSLRKASDITILKEFAKRWEIEKIARDSFMPNTYYLTIPNNKTGNALTLSNTFYESGLFEFAEPDFIKLLKRMSTNDPFLKNQWALRNTGQCIVTTTGQCLNIYGTPGADMKVTEAWTLTTGSPDIKVAVIDEGVDLNHPDLVNNLLPGYDATGLGSAGAPQGDDAHGTACAGLIAASGNNNKGIAGIAYNSKIVPVRIAYSDDEGDWVTQNSWLANAINWSWQTAKADILSNSWGGGASSSLTNNAISAAVNSGRNGKGALLLFAAGNENSNVIYPASNNLTIAVGATSMCDERKRSSNDPSDVDMDEGYQIDPLGVSCDNEKSWGSNYGTNLDITAPGVRIYTTDISGSKGYSTGDYYAAYNGTSSACPNAAGVMALILSINPNLTQAQARHILESSCDKVGGYNYRSVAGQPSGTWSSDLGYGRVNAYRAVLDAQNMINAPDSSILALNSAITITPSPIIVDQNFEVNVSIKNLSQSRFQGKISIDLLKAESGQNSYLEELDVIENIDICANCNSNTLTLRGKIDRDVGSYRLAIFYLPAGASESEWKLVGKGNYVNPILINVSNEPEPYLNVSSILLSYSPSGGNESFSVNSNTNWTVRSSQPWVSFNPASGNGDKNVIVSCQPHMGTTSRSATITVSAGNINKTVFISQAAVVLSVSRESMEFESSGGNQPVNVLANIGWTATSDQPWVNVNPTSGTNSGAFDIICQPNTRTDIRNATVRVTGENITRTIIITQKGVNAELTVLPDILNFEASGGISVINITSNTNWTAVSNQTWIMLSPSSGSKDGNFNVSCEPNTFPVIRMATIVVTSADINRVINVTQAAGQGLTISPTILTFDASGGNQKAAVIYGSNWLGSSNASWVSVTPVGGSGNSDIQIRCQPNPNNIPRVAFVAISGSGTNQNIQINQQGVLSNSTTIAAAGYMNTSDAQASLEWTLGEPVIETIGSNLILTQGFHQTFSSDLTSTEQPLPEDLFLKIFPNPTVDKLNIQLRADTNQSLEIQLMSMDGKILFTLATTGIDVRHEIDMTKLPAGIYVLTMHEKIRHWQIAQQIIKTK